jgi:hypothetical protein
MPGGKGNIKPEDGRQFSKDYQPEEKWTEERALDLGNELIAWQKENAVNIFFDEFLILEKGYYEELIAYLCKKYTSFLKLINKARKIQEIKLKKYGTADKLNASMTKFVLINNHNWKEQSHIDHTNDGKAFNNSITDDELISRINRILKSGE